MKTAYKIVMPILTLSIFPILFFLPLLHLNITSSLAGSLSGTLGIPEYSSIYHWIKAGSQMDETQKALWKNIFDAIKDKDGTLGSMFTNRHFVYMFLIFAALMLALALAAAVFAIATKKYGVTLCLSAGALVSAFAMNKSFDGFAKPFLSGKIGISSLLGNSDSSGLLGNLLGSLAKVESLELAAAYSLAFFVLLLAAVFALIALIYFRNAD